MKNEQPRIPSAAYLFCAACWLIFSLVSLYLMFPWGEPAVVHDPFLLTAKDFRFSIGSILVGVIRPLAFLATAFVCLGVSAWLFVMSTARE